MSARQETYCVRRSNQGWWVQTAGGHQPAGPYADKELAIAMVLVAVRNARPSRLRISDARDEWRVEFVRAADPAPSSAIPPRAEPAGPR